MAMNNWLVKAGLAVLIMIFGITTSWAQLFTQSVLANESCLSAPTLTSVMAHDNHAYVTALYPTEYGLEGNLLKYRTQSGIIMDRNNLPIYRNGSVALGADLWATGLNFNQFGTKGMLSRHKSDDYLWVSADKSSDKLIKVSAGNLNLLSGYVDNELQHIRRAIGIDSSTVPIGAVIYPPSIHTPTGVMIYGDSLGVLRMVDASTGRQIMAYLPHRILGAQLGVDAQWSLHEVRTNNTTRLIAVGGFGQSATGLMALDVTDVTKGGSPKVLYDIAPNANFDRLSYIHAPISLGYIKQTDQRRAVFVFGGGVDGCYENNGAGCQKSAANGAVIYVIDAITGQKITEWQNDSLNLQDMRQSFGGELTLVDRQRDGMFDHVYAADLGGQIFRIDVNPDDFMNAQAVHIFHANNNNLPIFDKNRAHFYQKPIVSIYPSGDYAAQMDAKRFALITIASNDRSIVDGKPNHVYGIFDKGLINRERYSPISKNQLELISPASTPSLRSIAHSGGWYYKLQINGNDAVTVMGSGVAVPTSKHLSRRGIHGMYQLSVIQSKACPSDTISQLQTYCLPFGVCSRDKSLLSSQDDAPINNQSALISPIIQGGWTAGAMVNAHSGATSWQLLRPSVDDRLDIDGVDMNDPDEPNAENNTLAMQMLRTIRPTRWYDVRNIGDNY